MIKDLYDVVVYGYSGEPGAAAAARAHEDMIKGRFRRNVAERMITPPEEPSADELYELLGSFQGFSQGDFEVILPREGAGILSTFYDLAQERRCGIAIARKSLPIRQDTIEIGELLELDPYRLESHAAVILVPCGCGEGVARLLSGNKKSLPAACVGRLTDGRDKIITDKSAIEHINRS